MVKKHYKVDISGKKIAKAMLKNQPVSLKYAVEAFREIRGKNVKWAERFFKDILEGKRYLPLKKYIKKIGHRKGKAVSGTKVGRYPKRLCKKFLELLKLVKANADYQGLDSENLIIRDGFASYGFRRFSHQPQGRIAGKIRRKKSTHLEIVVVEGK